MKYPRRLTDRKSTRLNSSHTVIYTLSLHDALPIFVLLSALRKFCTNWLSPGARGVEGVAESDEVSEAADRSEEHTSELQSHRDLHSFPTRRSSDLCAVERTEEVLHQLAIARRARGRGRGGVG